MRPITFELTEEEANVAAARAAWRASLRDGLLARHLAPLAAFALFVLFAAILGFTGLIGRRAAEIALIAAAAVYMAYRMWTRRRFFAARQEASAWIEGLRKAGALTLSLDAEALRLRGASLQHEWRLDGLLEAESVSGLIYVWPVTGDPLVWPARAHGDPAEADAALALARRHAGQKTPMTAIVDEDD